VVCCLEKKLDENSLYARAETGDREERAADPESVMEAAMVEAIEIEIAATGDCAPPEKKRRTRGPDADSDEDEGDSDEDEGGSDSDPGGDCSGEGFEGGSDEDTGDEDGEDENGLLYSLALARSVVHGFKRDMRHEWVPYFATEGERAGVRAAGREWVCLALNRILDPDDITTVSSVPPMTDEFEACVEETMDFNPEDYSKCRYRLQCTFARLVDRNNRYLDAMVAAFNDIVDHIPLKFLVE
jgi:hypothetical protein